MSRIDAADAMAEQALVEMMALGELCVLVQTHEHSRVMVMCPLDRQSKAVMAELLRQVADGLEDEAGVSEGTRTVH